MIDFNDLQKPLVAALLLGAAATVGFAAGFVVGRDPETARRLARAAANGLARTRIAMADAMEGLGDLWAEARDQAHREIESERSAATEAPVVAEKVTVAVAATRAPRKKKAVRRPRAKAARRAAKQRTVDAA
jgi:type IV secretory pathway TrbL component